MADLNNPHDTFIRDSFRDPEDAAVLLQAVLPDAVTSRLVLAELTLADTSFITEDLRELQSDLLFTIPVRGGSTSQVYLLFEHKSYPDPGVFVQLLGYLAEIYRRQWRESSALVPVLPFVFYHGEESWQVGTSFASSLPPEFRTEPWLCYIPDFQAEVLDLPRQSVDQLEQHASVRVILRLVQEIRNPDIGLVMQDIFRTLNGIFSTEKKLAVLHRCLLYLLSQTDQELANIARVLDRLEIQDYGDTMITTADKLRQEGKLQGIQEGKLEGRQEGDLQARLDTARKLAERRTPIADICDITGLSEHQLREQGILK